MEERLARLKRERRALEEEIEVAESKKKRDTAVNDLAILLKRQKFFSSSYVAAVSDKRMCFGDLSGNQY